MIRFISAGSLVYIFCLVFSPIYIYMTLIGTMPEAYLSLLFASTLAVTVFSEKARYIKKTIFSRENRAPVIVIALFLAYILTIQLVYFSLGDRNDNLGRSLFLFNFTYFIYYVVWLICGIYIGKLIIKHDNESLLTTAWLAITIFHLSNISPDGLKIDLSKIPKESIGIYLGLSDAYAIISIIAIGSSKNILKSISILAASLFMLFILQSRSSMACTLFSAVLGYTLYSQPSKKILYLIILGVCAFVLAPFAAELLSTDERMQVLFTKDYSSDGSYIERGIQLKYGLQHILDNPILGGYEKIVIDLGTHGAYIHNILSFWQVYGLLGFILALYFFILFPTTTLLNHDLTKQAKTTLTMLIIYIALQIVFSRSYVYNYSWFMVGFSLLVRIKPGCRKN